MQTRNVKEQIINTPFTSVVGIVIVLPIGKLIKSENPRWVLAACLPLVFEWQRWWGERACCPSGGCCGHILHYRNDRIPVWTNRRGSAGTMSPGRRAANRISCLRPATVIRCTWIWRKTHAASSSTVATAAASTAVWPMTRRCLRWTISWCGTTAGRAEMGKQILIKKRF